jgi:uncharacterized membrane protein
VASSDMPGGTSGAPGTCPGAPQPGAEVTGLAAGAASRPVRRTIWPGVLAGFGVAAFADETLFHQILHWHHFYDKSTMAAGLVSDGLFHAFGFTALVAGLFMRADALRRGGFIPQRWWGALLLGAGGFQLYDGTIQHKVLRLHQIRYHVTLWPYDLSWNVLAVIMIIAGIWLIRGAGAARPGIFRTGADPAS